MTSARESAVLDRRPASPYARRLARERAVALAGIAGSGPGGRIVAADILAWRPPVAVPSVPVVAPEAMPPVAVTPHVPVSPAAPAAAAAVISFAATADLGGFQRLAADLARAGVEIEVLDLAMRAARLACGDARIAAETGGRQWLAEAAGHSIGAERRERLAAGAAGRDAVAEPALATLLVLQAGRARPVSLPLLPGRALRLVLTLDRAGAAAHALLVADPARFTEAEALDMLDAFVAALEQPLALLA